MSALVLFASLWPGASAVSVAQENPATQASQLESQGRFLEAAAVLRLALDRTSVSNSQVGQLELGLERLRRIKLDFPLRESELFAELKKSVRNLTRQEYEQWVREGRFDSREIDGQRYFMAASVSNLFFRYPELGARRTPLKNTAPVERRYWETCVEIKKAALAARQPYVLPKRFEVTMKVTANPGAAPTGETIHAWLPIPRGDPVQSDFALVASSSTPIHVDDETSCVRAVYLEEPARETKSTEFKIQYDYTTHGVWFDIDAADVRPADPNDPSLKKFTQEAAHVVFTPELRALAKQIAGDETNAALRARKFYEWIAENIKYSFAIEYSTIPNISEYCRSRGYGDCGQEALLFITLCRISGIPARWQSGWTIFPGAKSNHDWTEIYLAPYGWVPVDPYMGVYATRYASTLTFEQRRELRDFYFGGLDQYRMAANSDHSQVLTPAKQSMRSDDVDFQRGELEWGRHNIYFDQFSYELTAKELILPRGKLE